MRFITMMGTAALSMTAATLAQSITFNEIRTGAGNAEYIELKGTPGASMAGLTIVVLGDGTSDNPTAVPPVVGTKTGVVEWLYRFAATDVIGSNGYLVLHNSGANPNYATNAVPPVPGPDPATGGFLLPIDSAATNIPWGYQTPTGSAGDTQLEAPDNMTFLLVSDYTGTDTFQTRAPNSGAAGQDLDTNDDGVLDITPWTAILDSVAFKESNGAAPTAGQDWWYSPTTCGPYISRTVAPTGTVIAAWDFQTTTTGGTALSNQDAAQSRVFTANFGSGTLYADGTNGASSWTAAINGTRELNAFTGTDTNATGDMATTTTSPAALALLNSSANGKAVVFKFPMASILGLSVSYATQKTATGFATQQWAWSTDATTWTNIDVISPDASFGTTPKILAPLSALDGAADAYLRMTFAGCTNASGNNRLDNVKLLTNAVISVVNKYAGPTVGIKQANGTWFIGVASTTVGQQDTPGSLNYAAPTYTCGDPNAGDCAVAHDNAFCSDACCCAYVGSLDPFCITVRWDSFCVTAAAGCAANCSSAPCPADLNGDTIVNGADLGIMLGDWGGSERDLNGDSIVNGADLGLLLGAWGNCP